MFVLLRLFITRHTTISNQGDNLCERAFNGAKIMKHLRRSIVQVVFESAASRLLTAVTLSTKDCCLSVLLDVSGAMRVEYRMLVFTLIQLGYLFES